MSERSTARTRTGRSARGASAVEFALIAPILFAMLFGVIDFSMVLTQRGQVSLGAAAAARQYTIQLREGKTQTEAKDAAAATFYAQSDLAPASATLTWRCVGTACDPASPTTCPSATDVAPPLIVLEVRAPARTVTQVYSSLITTVAGSGDALCSYSF